MKIFTSQNMFLGILQVYSKKPGSIRSKISEPKALNIAYQTFFLST